MNGANQWTGFYMISASVMKGLNMPERGTSAELNVVVKFRQALFSLIRIYFLVAVMF